MNFRKIVSRLSFSPTTVTDLADYATRLKKRQHLRAISIFLLAGLSLCQLITVLRPPQISAGASSADTVRGGFTSLENVIEAYDKNISGFQDLSAALKIDRADLAAAKNTSFLPEQFNFATSRTAASKSATLPIIIQFNDNIFYNNQLVSELYTNQLGWQGKNSQGQPFFVAQVDGTIFSTQKIDFAPEQVSAGLQQSILVSDASLESGRITNWTLTIKNNSPQTISQSINLPIGDLLEYASISSTDGGVLLTKSGLITWPRLTLQPGETKQLVVAAQINTGLSNSPLHFNGLSHDCQIDLYFGNFVSSVVPCATQKKLEFLLLSLPKISSLKLLTGYLVVLFLSLILYWRDNLTSREIKIIRHQLNTGGL